MKTMLKSIDIFGYSPELNILGNSRYKTQAGGAMSIISCFCLIVFMVLFGDDFYHRKNPKVIETKIFNSEYPLTSLSTKQGVIAWKFEDHYSVSPNTTNILYPKIKYESYAMNN